MNRPYGPLSVDSAISLIAGFGGLNVTALTTRAFPDPAALGVDLFAEGGTAVLTNLDVREMNSMWD